jgi:hypothetical protein
MAAQKREFIDFMEDQIGKIRLAINTEVEAMMEPIGELDCINRGVGITNDNGNVDVSTIYHAYFGKCVRVKDETGLIHDMMDLDTDSMNAIYEHVYYRVYQQD